jgi:hypothetical protein
LFDLLMLFRARLMHLALFGQPGFFQLIEEGVAHLNAPFSEFLSPLTPALSPLWSGFKDAAKAG